MKNKALLTILITICSFGCKKGGDDPSPEASLTTGKWLLTSYKMVLTSSSTGGQTTFEYFNSFPDCTKDNYTIFKPNNTVEGDEGPTKCSASAAQTYDGGTWRLNTDQMILTRREVSMPAIDYKVNELTANSLVFERDSTTTSFTMKTVSSYKNVN